MAVQTLNDIDVDLSVNETLVGCATSITLDMSSQVNEGTCRQSGGWTDKTIGRHNWTATIEALMRIATGTDTAGNVTYANFVQMWKNRTPIEVSFGSSISGATREEGTALISGVSASSPENANATISVSLEGTGALTTVTNP
jgi:predicted secreted protein